MNNNNTTLPAAVRALAGTPALLVIALAAGISTVSTAAEYAVNIPFDGDCPTTPPGIAPGDWTVTLSKSNRDTLKWTAVDSVSGANYTGGYEIYFDPFKNGPPLKDSNNDGVIESGPMHDHVPLAEYKYTIVGEQCVDQPLDPRIRVQ